MVYESDLKTTDDLAAMMAAAAHALLINESLMRRDDVTAAARALLAPATAKSVRHAANGMIALAGFRSADGRGEKRWIKVSSAKGSRRRIG